MRWLIVILSTLGSLSALVLSKPVSWKELIGNFDLVGGPPGCPNTIATKSVQPHFTRGTVEILVSNIAMCNNTCSGDGYVVLAEQVESQEPTVRTSQLLTTAVLRRIRIKPKPKKPKKPSLSGGSTSFSPKSLGLPKPIAGKISRPTNIKALPAKGTRLSSGGERGTKWLGSSYSTDGWNGGKGSKWRKRRKSASGEEDDYISELSSHLENLDIPHYYGFHVLPLTLNLRSLANFTTWGFQCGRCGADFRTRFMHFTWPGQEHPGLKDIEFFTKGENYLLVSGSTVDGENTRNPEVPCIYSSREHGVSTGVNATKSEDGELVDCLPGDAMVDMADGDQVRVDGLRKGDRVERGNEVFMFTHWDDRKVAKFLRFVTSDDGRLELTPGHYLYKNNGELAEARDVRVGDTLLRADGSTSVVREITEVMKTGVYNPQTVQGDIVVSGFVVSTYTEAVEPSVAHSALSPLRAVWRFLGISSDAMHGGMPELLQS